MIGILWLASYPKSGNTWTRAFLHNLLGLLEGDDSAYDINRINEFTTWDISADAYEKHMGKPPSEDNKAEIAAVRPRVQADIANNTNGLAIVKTHHALVSDRGHPTINFEVASGAVYLVRNPLDIAVSFAHHRGATVDDAIDAMANKNYETAVTDKSVYEVYGSWSLHVESWTRRPHRAIHVMRYEDMLKDPRKAFGKLAEHLLLRPTEGQLLLAIDRSSFDQLKAQELEHGFKEKSEKAESFFREGKAGVWRDQLTRRQVRQIVTTHATQMRRFGYITPEIEHLVR
jgi:hypothetical protein